MSLYRKLYKQKKTDLEKLLGKMTEISGKDDFRELPLDEIGKLFLMALAGATDRKGKKNAAGKN
jgi:hypothetical protein